MGDSDLRYKVALGDLIIIINEIDCSARWGWIPMIDLAVSFYDIRYKLAAKETGTQTFEFTESEAKITFERIGNDVWITTDYIVCSESVPFTEYDYVIREFCGKVFREAVQRFPALEGNEVFRALRKRTALD